MQPATGFLVLDEVPGADTLWLVATGTGVGPFLSILATPEPWTRFKKVVLIYAARYINDLAYLDLIRGWEQQYGQQFSFVPVVSREDFAEGLKGRIPQLLADQSIQQAGSYGNYPRK